MAGVLRVRFLGTGLQVGFDHANVYSNINLFLSRLTYVYYFFLSLPAGILWVRWLDKAMDHSYKRVRKYDGWP